jgi:hypothetical protein
MSDVAERVRALAEVGKTAMEIAEELDISRQRVYYIGRKSDIPIERPGARAPYNIVPRIITGGVRVNVNAYTAGTVSELLVAADLLARGWYPYRPIIRNRGHDLIATRGDEIITIEVRSGRRVKGGGISFAQLPRDRSQFYGVVCIAESVVYLPDLPPPPA